MSDELIVCIVILILSVIVAVIVIVYICALVAITRAEGYQNKRYNMKSEIDCERCPKCKVRLDWRRWHRCNDEEGAEDDTE